MADLVRSQRCTASIANPDTSIVDLAMPATTNVDTIGKRLQDTAADETRMTVVFSPYQSLDVIATAQGAGAVGAFDLVLCDEAHRTTGVVLSNDDEPAFVKVQDAGFLAAKMRLYGTATPKPYDDAAKGSRSRASPVHWRASVSPDEGFGP